MSCGGLTGLDNRVNQLCGKVKKLSLQAGQLEYASVQTNFQSSDIDSAINNTNLVYNPATLINNQINLLSDNQTFRVRNAGVYEVSYNGLIRGITSDSSLGIFIYEIETNPAQPFLIRRSQINFNDDPVINIINNHINIKALVRLPANGTIKINVLNSGPGARINSLEPINNTIPVQHTLSIVRLA